MNLVENWLQLLWKSLRDNLFYLIIVISVVFGMLRLLIHTEIIMLDWPETYEICSCIWIGILMTVSIYNPQCRTIALFCIIIILIVELLIHWLQLR